MAQERCVHCRSTDVWYGSSWMRHAARRLKRSKKRYCRSCGAKWGGDLEPAMPSLWDYSREVVLIAAAIAVGFLLVQIKDSPFIHAVFNPPAQTKKR